MRRFMSLVCGTALAASPWLAMGQEAPGEGPRREVGPMPIVRPLPHWIGAMCAPADEALCAQLDVQSGLVVLDVIPDSPAAAAGLQRHDVLTAVGDKALRRATDLVEAVNAADDQELKFTYYRAGKKDTLTVQPAKRPEFDVLRRFVHRDDRVQPVEPDAASVRELTEKLRQNLPEEEARRLQDWMERMQRGDAPPMRMLAFGPGVVMQQLGGGPLPKGVKVQISKNGDKPAEIHVERGDEKWDVTADELDKLPPDLRGPIGAMLGGGAHGAMMMTPGGAASAAVVGSGTPGVRLKIDGAEGVVHPFTMALPPGAAGFPAVAELENLKQQVEQLQRQVEALQKNLPSAKSDGAKPAKKSDSKE